MNCLHRLKGIMLAGGACLLVSFAMVCGAQAKVTVDYKDYYRIAYQQGKNHHIIHQNSYQFTQECQRELGPDYVAYVKQGGKTKFPSIR